MPFYDRNKKCFRRKLFTPIILSTWCSIAIVTRIIKKYEISPVIDLQHVWLHPLICWCYYILIVVNVNLKITILQKFFDTFNEIDSDLQNNFNTKPPVLNCVALGAFFVNFIFVAINVADFVLYEFDATLYTHFIYYTSAPWGIYNIHISEFIKMLLSTAIQKRFRVFNNFLDAKTDYLFPGQISIDHCIKTHRDCCELVAIFNDLFGLEILVSIMQTFMYILRLCFLLITSDARMFWFVLMRTSYAVVCATTHAHKCILYIYDFVCRFKVL